MKVQPIGDRILVKRLDAEGKTKGGIIIPDAAKEKPKEGKVISVGAGKVKDDGKREALTVKAGDRIIFTSYAGSEVTLEGEEFIIMREEDVLGVVC